MTQLLPEADVREVVRLLGDVAGMDAPPAARKTRLMDGLSDLVDADVWLWTTTQFDLKADYSALRVLQGGLSEEQVAAFYEISYETDLQPEAPRLLELVKRGEPFTRRRAQLVSDEAWRARVADHPRYRAMNLDQNLYSFMPLDRNVWSCIGMHRHWGRPAFSEREARLVHIVFSEIPWLHRADLPDEEGAAKLPRLSPRLRTVFSLMMEGYSRSQIAEHLGLSTYTVRDYMSTIYRHFDVESQIELMRRLRCGDGRHDHALSMAPSRSGVGGPG